MKYYLGVDLGGTNIAVGVVNEEFQIVGRGKLKTRAPRPVEEIALSIKEACETALENAGITLEEVAAVGVGSPGVVDRERGEIEFASNLQFFNAPLRDLLSKELQKEVYLGNDAACATFGEVIAGGAKGYHDVVALTIGTGVGGGIVIGGKLYDGFNNAAGELGHVGMAYKSEHKCACGLEGCVEMFCSASALIRQTKEKMKQCPDSKMWELCEGNIHKVGGRTAFEAMRAGDPDGIAVVEQFCEYLGFAVNNLINTLQPQVILIGGGISKEGDYLLGPVREYCRHRSFVKDVNRQTKVEAATLGNDAGIIGAAFLFSA